jgi:hypothetical protein
MIEVRFMNTSGPEMRQVIGVRILRTTDGGEINVRIGAPYSPDGGNEEFWCPYIIDGLGNGGVKYAAGADGVQALFLCLMKIGVDLYTSDDYKKGNLIWGGGVSEKDLGFPLPNVLKDILSG